MGKQRQRIAARNAAERDAAESRVEPSPDVKCCKADAVDTSAEDIGNNHMQVQDAAKTSAACSDAALTQGEFRGRNPEKQKQGEFSKYDEATNEHCFLIALQQLLTENGHAAMPLEWQLPSVLPIVQENLQNRMNKIVKAK